MNSGDTLEVGCDASFMLLQGRESCEGTVEEKVAGGDGGEAARDRKAQRGWFFTLVKSIERDGFLPARRVTVFDPQRELRLLIGQSHTCH